MTRAVLPALLIAVDFMPQSSQLLAETRMTKTLHRRFVISWCAMVSLLLPIAFLIYSVSPLISDNYLYDTWLSMQSSPPSQDILIIEIDEPSLQRLGRWPWPRDIHTQLIEKLDAAGASAVILDILLAERSRDPQQDEALAQAMKAHGNVYLPLALLPEVPPDAPYQDTLMPMPSLAAAAASVGHINIDLGNDGVAREVILKKVRRESAWPQLMAAVAGVSDEQLVRSPVRIPYRGWPDHYPSVSYHDVLEGRLPDAFLENRTVLVGMTAMGMGDRYNTSLLSPQMMAGVEVHANLLDAIRSDELIYPVPSQVGALLAGLPIVLLVLLTWWLRFRFMLAMVLALSATAVIASLLALRMGWWWPPSASLVSLSLASLAIIWRSQATLLAWFDQELKLLYHEPLILPHHRVNTTLNEGGKLYQQLQSLEFALSRLVNGRRFVLDVMHSLPLPIFILNEAGNVLLGNNKAIHLSKSGQRTAPIKHIKDLPDIVHFERDDGFSSLWPPTPETVNTHKELTGGLCQDNEGNTYRLEMGRLTTSASDVGGGWLVWLVDLTSEVAIEKQRTSMLSFLSHDMKAPQTRALALIDEQRGSATALPEPRFFAEIEQSLRTSLGMINDFIGLTRAKSFELDHAFILFEDLVMEVLDQVRPLAQQKSIDVISAFNDEDGAPVFGDKGYLARAVFNLIENAVKYGREKGYIKVTVSTQEDWTILDVMDNGIGIGSEDKARIFEDFQRSDGATIAQGHGLGLALVKTVAEKHGGSIACQSTLGEGSHFTLKLPSGSLD